MSVARAMKDRALSMLIPAMSRCVSLFRPQIRAKSWVAEEIPDRPHMERPGLEHLQRKLADARVYLEYGSGGSTILAAQVGVGEIHTVESDESFLEAVRQRVLRYRPDVQIHTHYVDIGPTKQWGIPTDPACAARWPLYCHAPWPKLHAAGMGPDLVLIDGRFRIASFLISAMFAKAGTSILFDDYFYRPQYRYVEKFLTPVTRAGRMAEFVVPESLDTRAMMLSLLPVVTDPD